MSLYNAFLRLSGAYDARIERDVPLSRLTSLRVGGPAALVATVHTYPALVRCLEVLDLEGVEWAVFGKGTDIVCSDEGYRGCIVVLGREFSRITVGADGATVTAGAAAPAAKAVNAAYQSGLSGLEMLAGIPGTLGGAVALDAGTRHHWVGPSVSALVALKPGEGLRRYEGGDIDWGYRRTSLPPDEIVLEAEFSLAPSSKAEVARATDRRLAARKGRVPVGRPTCGEVFLDPAEQQARRLLVDAGAAGLASGGAQASAENPNYVVNAASATAADVLTVIGSMQERVKEVSGVRLQTQVKFLGFTS